ncbi:MAG TPA: two-component sensor histidine kinase [Acidimicrobiaceae bacterium]|nr:two-component sensor histidine kinase [Acidimicrobiaceae bacterium]HCV34787.1 two-component sensor histidine kinase [Acidimicrobiaceae bacterium]
MPGPTTGSELSPDHSPSLGLGTRIAVLFAVGGLLVSVGIASATLALTRRQLVEAREQTAAAIAVSNATRLSNQLTPDSTIEDLPTIADSLTKVEGGQRVIRLGDDWLPAPELDRNDLPSDLVTRVGDRRSGQVITNVRGEPHVVVGIPLSAFDADYYAVVDLSDIIKTLDNLEYVLLGAGAATTVLAALLGSWASRRTLRPLRRVRGAAEAIAGGRLDTRLGPQSDPDLDRLSDSFNEMARALEARIHRDARFASDVSHELRSPLTTLMAGVGVLEARRHELSDRSRTALDLLAQDLERFNRLVNELLEISGYDAGVADLDLGEVNVAQFLRATVDGLEDIYLDLPPGTESLVIAADKRRLARIMANLLDNAQRYGGGATRVSVEYGNVLTIAVEDDGPGVPVDERTAIFDRFSRGSAGGSRGVGGGTGLGLSLVAEDLRLHGGRAQVEDRPDGQSGARFTLELPLTNPDDETGEEIR